MDFVAPLGIGFDPVNIGFGSRAESDNDNMLEIVAFSPVVFKNNTDQGPFKKCEKHGHTVKDNEKTSRHVADLHKDNSKQEKDHAGGVGLEQMHVLFGMMLKSFWLIEVESGIDDHVDRNQESQHGLVLDKLSPVSVSGKQPLGKRTVETNIIAETKREIDDQGVKNNVKPVKYFLIFFDHKLVPLFR